jgi:hypothetical protein
MSEQSGNEIDTSKLATMLEADGRLSYFDRRRSSKARQAEAKAASKRAPIADPTAVAARPARPASEAGRPMKRQERRGESYKKIGKSVGAVVVLGAVIWAALSVHESFENDARNHLADTEATLANQFHSEEFPVEEGNTRDKPSDYHIGKTAMGMMLISNDKNNHGLTAAFAIENSEFTNGPTAWIRFDGTTDVQRTVYNIDAGTSHVFTMPGCPTIEDFKSSASFDTFIAKASLPTVTNC